MLSLYEYLPNLRRARRTPVPTQHQCQRGSAHWFGSLQTAGAIGGRLRTGDSRHVCSWRRPFRLHVPQWAHDEKHRLGGVARAPTGQPARVIRQGDVHALPSCDRSSPAGRSAFLLPPIAIGEDLGAKGIEGENTPAGDGGVIRAKDRPPLGELVSPQEPAIGDAAHRAGARCFVPSMPSQVAGEALARTPLGLRVAARTRAACSRRTHHVMGFP